MPMCCTFLVALAASSCRVFAAASRPDIQEESSQHYAWRATATAASAADKCIGEEEEEEEVQMLQHRSAQHATTRSFRAAPGVVLGRFRLIKLLVPGRPPAQAVPAQLEWPEGFEAFSSKYGEGTLLGRGGQGEVWKAEDISTGVPVAVKIYKDNTVKPAGYLFWDGANEEQMEGLRDAMKECDLMHMLRHAHILSCLQNNIIPTDDPPLPSHIVLELGGDDLTKWIQQRNNTLGDPEEARKWIAQTAQALRFLQSQDPPIIHHDLKPDNVMLLEGADGESIAKVFDFGCAINATEEGQHSKWGCATMMYAAPETLSPFCQDPEDRKLTFQMPAWSFDIFSLGMMYWEMLCPNISTHNGYMKAFLSFGCHPGPPLGDGPYEGGQLRGAFDSADESTGEPKCPSISDDEVSLIDSMLMSDPKRRPSPSEVLKFPLLAKYDV